MNKIKEIAGCAMVGGNSDNGGQGGPFYLNSNVGVGSANVNIGACLVIMRLLFSFRKENIYLSPGYGVSVTVMAKICSRTKNKRAHEQN